MTLIVRSPPNPLKSVVAIDTPHACLTRLCRLSRPQSLVVLISRKLALRIFHFIRVQPAAFHRLLLKMDGVVEVASRGGGTGQDLIHERVLNLAQSARQANRPDNGIEEADSMRRACFRSQSRSGILSLAGT